MSEEAAKLASYGRRTHTRDGWQRKITAIEVDDLGRLCLDIDFTEIETGRFIRVAKDQPTPLDGIRLTDPPILVPDGEEPNPDYDENDPNSLPTRIAFREDSVEALKVSIDRALAAALAHVGAG